MSARRSHGDTMRSDLEAVRGYDPGYDADAGGVRLEAALAVASGATALCGVLPKAASAGGSAAVKTSTLGSLAIVLALGTGGAATTIFAGQGHESGPSRPSVEPARSVVKVAAKLERDAAMRVSLVRATVAAAPAPTIEVEPAKTPPARGPAHPPPKPADHGRSIRDEVREVAALRDLLATDPAKALVGIDGRRGSSGTMLAEERAILAMEALVALGRPAEARPRARAFLALHPRSAYAARARTLLRAP